MAKRVGEHSFSVEMKSQTFVNKMVLQESCVVFEGFLGELKGVSIIEGLMLQIEGANGVLRLDITPNEIGTCLSANRGEQ